ncbi:prepilin-type N-terminal cleavage/methylation domain-containing protein [Campylobacter concisus]|uniref:prepilin-type N-terminal cleavage/methylation domain-containing protein n=1 Tax=Campylobacter concisus TaxID=199 RepID=UPI0018841B8F|nr:prepilin-type N-terminal cleavage/methylation domain-containing protein [Campylobacter concisus]MBE9835004.1 prepilin-type N-terminal cleavage/methylation domain-containing protein [Campylobacter concisus]MBE9857389.1 prepilin-type N-terminal cleavage/methylation domain-containing protein [Campylobacter concisus]
MKRAFTLLELVVVIVVLGIIAMMSFNAIMNIYSNYFQTKTVNELETQTEIALEQISKRLEHRIKPSVIARKTDGAFLALNDNRVNLDAKYEILEFIPYAYEIFNDVISLDANDHVIEQGGKAGRYSGYADLAKSSPATGLISPGSNFSTEVVETIKDLTCREDTNATCVDFTKKDGGVVAIFSDVYYNVQDSFGYKGDITKLDIAKVGVKSTDGNTLEISGFANKQISEQYHLAYTANAIVPEQSADPKDAANGVFDLNLYYDYRPWMGEKYKQNGEKATLAKNVTRFVFTEKNGVIVLKLCMRAKNSEITICKSKAVY